MVLLRTGSIIVTVLEFRAGIKVVLATASVQSTLIKAAAMGWKKLLAAMVRPQMTRQVLYRNSLFSFCDKAPSTTLAMVLLIPIRPTK